MKALDEIKLTKKVNAMKISNKTATVFFKSRSQARTVKSGKLVDLWQELPEHSKSAMVGSESNKRWCRSIAVEHKQKDNTLTLTQCKDFRYPEKAKAVQVKVKKLKEMVK